MLALPWFASTIGRRFSIPFRARGGNGRTTGVPATAIAIESAAGNAEGAWPRLPIQSRRGPFSAGVEMLGLVDAEGEVAAALHQEDGRPRPAEAREARALRGPAAYGAEVRPGDGVVAHLARPIGSSRAAGIPSERGTIVPDFASPCGNIALPRSLQASATSTAAHGTPAATELRTVAPP